MLERIEAWAREQPSKAALIHEDAVITYAALVRRIEATRRFLGAQIPPPSGLAVILIDNLADAWVVMLALRALGLDTVCVETLASAEALQLRNVVGVVTAAPEHALHRLGGEPLGAKLWVVPAQALYASDTPAEASPPRARPPFGGHILYTSGTTGTHKKVYCDPVLERPRLQRVAATRGDSRTTVNNALKYPLWTAAGYGQTLSILALGGTNVIVQRPGLLAEFFSHGSNRAILIPVLARQLVEMRKGIGEPSDTYAVSLGGGLCPTELLEDLYQWVSRKISIAYGSTECPTIARIRYAPGASPDWLEALPDRKIEIVDENDEALPNGQEGVLRVRLLEHDASSYLDDPEASRRHFRDGYFYPGDVAVRRADGRIRILGREGDVLNVAGVKMAAGPLEQKVQSLLGVDQVALFSGLDAGGAEELIVAVEAQALPGRPALETVAALFSEIRHVRFVAIAAFPRTTAGMAKVERAALRRMAFGALEAR